MDTATPVITGTQPDIGVGDGHGDAVYAELLPLARHRAYLDHLFILNDRGRLTDTGRSVFASQFCEIVLVCRQDPDSRGGGDRAERWIPARAPPRFGRLPRKRAFHGWMIGIRYRPPSAVFDEQRITPAALAGGLAGMVDGSNPLDGIVDGLDRWIEQLVVTTGLREIEARDPSDVAVASESALEAADGNPKVTALAAAAGISSRTLQRLVRARTGLAPKRYASLQRFSQALRCVALENDSLAQVAAQTGYSDQAHMTADLRRHAGISPGRLRTLARRQIRRDAVRFFKDVGLQSRVRLLVCDSAAAADTGKGPSGR